MRTRTLVIALAATLFEYACPDCEREWRRSEGGPVIPFTTHELVADDGRTP